jgi:hypothetical protein
MPGTGAGRSVGPVGQTPRAAVSSSRAASRAVVKLARAGLVPGLYRGDHGHPQQLVEGEQGPDFLPRAGPVAAKKALPSKPPVHHGSGPAGVRSGGLARAAGAAGEYERAEQIAQSITDPGQQVYALVEAVTAVGEHERAEQIARSSGHKCRES